MKSDLIDRNRYVLHDFCFETLRQLTNILLGVLLGRTISILTSGHHFLLLLQQIAVEALVRFEHIVVDLQIRHRVELRL